MTRYFSPAYMPFDRVNGQPAPEPAPVRILNEHGCWVVHKLVDREALEAQQVRLRVKVRLRVFVLSHAPTGICLARGTRAQMIALASTLPQIALDARTGEIDALRPHTETFQSQIPIQHRTTGHS